jgi:hypothetical protein
MIALAERQDTVYLPHVFEDGRRLIEGFGISMHNCTSVTQ